MVFSRAQFPKKENEEYRCFRWLSVRLRRSLMSYLCLHLTSIIFHVSLHLNSQNFSRYTRVVQERIANSSIEWFVIWCCRRFGYELHDCVKRLLLTSLQSYFIIPKFYEIYRAKSLRPPVVLWRSSILWMMLSLEILPEITEEDSEQGKDRNETQPTWLGFEFWANLVYVGLSHHWAKLNPNNCPTVIISAKRVLHFISPICFSPWIVNQQVWSDSITFFLLSVSLSSREFFSYKSLLVSLVGLILEASSSLPSRGIADKLWILTGQTCLDDRQ